MRLRSAELQMAALPVGFLHAEPEMMTDEVAESAELIVLLRLIASTKLPGGEAPTERGAKRCVRHRNVCAFCTRILCIRFLRCGFSDQRCAKNFLGGFVSLFRRQRRREEASLKEVCTAARFTGRRMSWPVCSGGDVCMEFCIRIFPLSALQRV